MFTLKLYTINEVRVELYRLKPLFLNAEFYMPFMICTLSIYVVCFGVS